VIGAGPFPEFSSRETLTGFSEARASGNLPLSCWISTHFFDNVRRATNPGRLYLLRSVVESGLRSALAIMVTSCIVTIVISPFVDLPLTTLTNPADTRAHRALMVYGFVTPGAAQLAEETPWATLERLGPLQAPVLGLLAMTCALLC
jgi:hypothetical protein